jgi:hypothetical protein
VVPRLTIALGVASSRLRAGTPTLSAGQCDGLRNGLSSGPLPALISQDSTRNEIH